MYNESVKKAQLKYQKESVKQVKFTLNKNTDEDIIEFLDSIENKNGLIKELIRDEMKRRQSK